METGNVSFAGLDLTPEQRKAVGFLVEFTKRMVLIGFPENKTPGGALNLIQEIYRVTDDMMTGCLKSGVKPHCKKGCYWCCFLRVKATQLEVLSIVDYLSHHLEPGEMSALRQRLVKTDEVTQGMDGYQRVHADMTCPLLVNGECLAYAVRPIACRVYHSLNVSECKASLDKYGSRVTVRHDISGLGMGLLAGLTDGLRTLGLQTRQLELIAGLRIAIDEPGSGLAKLWLAGESAFVGAEIAGAK